MSTQADDPHHNEVKDEGFDAVSDGKQLHNRIFFCEIGEVGKGNCY